MQSPWKIPIAIASSLASLTLSLGAIGPAKAADIICRGVMFGDTDFAAYHGEVGFGYITLTFRSNGRTVEIPLNYIRQTPQGEALFQGNNPDQPSDIVQVIAPSPVRAGTQIQAIYNGNRFTGTCSSNILSPPPGNGDVPSSGSFMGQGNATNPVFRRNQSVETSLNFNGNTNGFSVNVYVPSGSGAEVQYLGTITRLYSSGPNPNSFILEGTIENFASSRNNLQVVNTTGSCEIEVFDARITSVSCKARTNGGVTHFRGREEF